VVFCDVLCLCCVVVWCVVLGSLSTSELAYISA
jgi:hypothetical protein